LQSLPLSDAVNDALLNKKGLLGHILHTVMCNEQGNWQNIDNDDFKLDNQIIRDAYLESIKWAADVGQQLLAKK
jgi:c-di-GMP-related signal transduction protein